MLGKKLSLKKKKKVFTCEKAPFSEKQRQFEKHDCFQCHPLRMKPFLLSCHFLTDLKLQLHRHSVNASFSCILNAASLSGMC